MDFQQMLDYCTALSEHNERPWFHEHHDWYEAARKDYLELLELLRFTIAEAAPALADDILYMQAKDWMYRVARDMRYSQNKPPYNPAFRAYISPDRKSWQPIGYFLRIAPRGESCFGTGLWCEDTASMNLIRRFLSENHEEFQALLVKSRLSVQGDSLKKMPRGFDEADPAARWIKLKNWSVIADIPDDKLTGFSDFAKLIRRLVKRIEPLRLFLLDAARSRRTEKQLLFDFYNR